VAQGAGRAPCLRRLGWENRFQLTETGRYPVDLGFLLEIEHPRDRSEGWEVRWGPLFQADLGASVAANLNLLIEKHYGTDNPERAELRYQWQLRYRWGPAVFGRVKGGQRNTLEWNAGVLFGLTDASPRNQLRLQAEYEF
jgi:hypothetical protein